MREVRKTNCHFCGYLCAFHATVEDGRVVDLEPDPSRYPYDPKVLAGCRRWKMNLDVLDGDDRVNYPLRRVGERGANNWERVSWDEALDDIAQRLSQLRDRYGSETLASMIGGPHASFWPLHRFMNMFGSPNQHGHPGRFAGTRASGWMRSRSVGRSRPTSTTTQNASSSGERTRLSRTIRSGGSRFAAWGNLIRRSW